MTPNPRPVFRGLTPSNKNDEASPIKYAQIWSASTRVYTLAGGTRDRTESLVGSVRRRSQSVFPIAHPRPKGLRLCSGSDLPRILGEREPVHILGHHHL